MAPDPMYRIDGAWFICLDKKLFQKDDCTIVSLGINQDPSFDNEIVNKFDCRVESFDPYIEADIFNKIRIRKPELHDAVTLDVKSKWRFHKLGLAASEKDAKGLDKIGGTGTLSQLLDYTKLTNKV